MIIPMWAKLLAAGLLVAVMVGACQKRDERLIQKGVDIQLAKEAAQKEKDRIAMQKKEDRQREELAAIEHKRVVEKQEYEKVLAKLQHDVRVGNERLRIATVRKPPAVPTDPAPGGAEPEEGSVVVPEVASDILGIAGGTGQLVRDYNALLDAYRSLDRACSGVDKRSAPLLGDLAVDPDHATRAQ